MSVYRDLGVSADRLRPRGPAFSGRVSQAEIGGGRIGRGKGSAAVDIAHRLARHIESPADNPAGDTVFSVS